MCGYHLFLCCRLPVIGEFPLQSPVKQSFGVFFDLPLNKRLSKQSRRWWFKTPSRSLSCHCNGAVYSDELHLRYSHTLLTRRSLRPSLTDLPLDNMTAISQTIFLDDFSWMKSSVFNISLKFVPTGPIDNNPALVQIMAWHRIGDKNRRLLDTLKQICGAGWRWVNYSHLIDLFHTR